MNIRDYIIIAINSAADITLFRDQEVASHNRRNFFLTMVDAIIKRYIALISTAILLRHKASVICDYNLAYEFNFNSKKERMTHCVFLPLVLWSFFWSTNIFF